MASRSDTRQLLLPVTTIELAGWNRGISSTRRWEIDHRPTGSIDEAVADGRKETTGGSGNFGYEREVCEELA